MYELEGLAIPAIASLLGISAITVRWHLSKGRRELSGALKAYLGNSNDKD
jgi:DNA-directed RNA polymerase specialized sigma24 family protein